MAINLEKFKKDFDQLVEDGRLLEQSFVVKAYGEEKMAEVWKVAKEDRSKTFGKLPKFNVAYEAWYSECIVLLKQILPDRLQDFKDHFEPARNRKEVNFENYRIQDALKGLKQTGVAGEIYLNETCALPHFRQQLAILKAARKRFESSLFEIRQLVQADLFDSELDAARELLKNKFVRAAGAIAGVLLEKHLRQVCDDHAVNITKKNPGISDLNEALKAASVIEVSQWRHITLMGDYRNLCDHNKAKEPTHEQVSDLLDGTDKILKTIA